MTSLRLRQFLAIWVLVSLSGCTSFLPDETPVRVEAVIKRYVEDHVYLCRSEGPGILVDRFFVELKVTLPTKLYDDRLDIFCSGTLEKNHLLRQEGARVSFTVPRKYLNGLLIDPHKKHDEYFLNLDEIKDLVVAPTVTHLDKRL